MTERVTGYTLLISGILIIIMSAISIIFVFTKRAQPVQLFTYKGISIDSSALTPQMPDLSTIPGLNLPQQTVSPKPIEIIPADMLNGSANIFAHVAFMGFLLSVGSKIASLGVNLIRPIIVKTSQKSVSLETTA